MSGDRSSVFAAAAHKLVLHAAWKPQSMHCHRPVELVAALDGPIGLRHGAAAAVLHARSFVVPPMRRHALLGYEGRVVRIYADPGYRRLSFWKEAPVGADVDGADDLLDRIARFFDSARDPADASRLIEDWSGAWIGAATAPPCDKRVLDVLLQLDAQEAAVRADRHSLARLVNLSPPRFAAIFAENTGMPLGRYLIWRRVKIAMTLICAGKSITQAAAQAGFADGAHLTRSCRSTYGCPPSSFAGTRPVLLSSPAPAARGADAAHPCLAPAPSPCEPGQATKLDPPRAAR